MQWEILLGFLGVQLLLTWWKKIKLLVLFVLLFLDMFDQNEVLIHSILNFIIDY